MNGGFEQALEGLQVNLRLPDLWQQEAVRSLRDGEDVVVSAPTGAGKTFVFESLIDSDRSFSATRQAVYTVPTRALANDKFQEWKSAGWQVGIATGDLAENLDAPVIVATLETQRERLLAASTSGNAPALLVIDEYQMIGDRQRGTHYELAIALAPLETRLLLLSGSVGNPKQIVEWLTRLGRTARVVSTEIRPVPLDEIPLGGLPNEAPRKYSNFWQRLALGTLLSHYGPLLIFAPHRKAAEKIAWKIAEALPDDLPIELGKENSITASADLTRLLRKRVAYHHSGLSFSERAGIVEPLAKAGQLRVIVATMGLAAGINFSVRSVFVSDTTYQDGPFQRDVSPDELLQMFGRAGRRGLDETGYIICGHKSPRLADARPLELHRQNELDWPPILRRMHFAAEAGESPFEAARELRDRLFSRQRIPLGFHSGPSQDSEEEKPLFGLKPVRKEILNASGEWGPIRQQREASVPLSKALSYTRGRYRSAESDSRLISTLLPPRARLCRLDEKGKGPRRYGLEIAVSTKAENGNFTLTKFARQLSNSTRKDQTFTLSESQELLPDLFSEALGLAEYEALQERGRSLYLLGNFKNAPIDVYLDSDDQPLYQPQQRTVEIETETHYTHEDSGETINPAGGTPAHAWRQLGLIDKLGAPTQRGMLFSLFQGGEGLAIAAALEDPHYPIQEILFHLANLRGGHRFELDTVSEADRLLDSIGSERLAAVCRQAYGPVDFAGYLRLGLPLHYGEGAAEVISLMLNGDLYKLLAKGGHLDFGPGDVERTYVEWLSLLRHLRYAPDLENDRWLELKTAAADELQRHARSSPLAGLPKLPASVLQRPPQHGISYRSL